MFRVILIAVLATFLLTESAAAQQSTRRGRFFQRVKQELFGNNSSTPTPSKKNESATKTPTPSANPAANAPSSVRNTDSPRPARNQSSQVPQPSRQQQSTRAYPGNPRPQNQRTSSNTDFGFEITQNKSDQLIVARIDPRGNAAQAGMIRGDRVIEIGGIEANSVEEFEEISKVMNDGDQMEFKIKRNGLTKTLMITYGEPTQIDDDESDRSVSSNQQRRYDFAPPADDDRNGNSVLEGPAPTGTPNNTRAISSQRNIAQQNGSQLNGSQQNGPQHRFSDQGNNGVMIQQMRNIIQRQNEQIRRLQSEIANLKRFGR